MRLNEFTQGVAEVSDATLTSYLTKLDKDNLKHKMDPTKRSDSKSMKSGPNFVKAFTKLDNRKQGVAEGADDLTSLKAKASEISDKIDAIVKDGGRVGLDDQLSKQLKLIQAKIQQAKKQGVAENKEKEADYGDDYQAMVARVKQLAGMGPLKTVYDPEKRVYKNVPTAVQPAQQPKKER
jgi:hypothetical protein